jgi:RNA polymerase sigma-70 factor (ECF subfamily)
LEDNRLATAAANGDQEAFSILVKRYRPYVYRIAYKITLHEDDALDITQNVFVRLVEKIHYFNGRGRFRAWLATIAAREAINWLRSPSRREASTEPQVLAGLSDERQGRERSNPRDVLETVQRRQLVEGAMAHLSAQQRAIIALRLGEDMGPKEIAERLGLPARQVRLQLHRAIAKIRQALAEKIA